MPLKKILLTNDDGITSPGLTTLVRELQKTGLYDLRVSAPEREQSGVGHCITIHSPLFAQSTDLQDERGKIDGVPACMVAGTPADCVKISLTNLFPDFKPDLVVSGINRGPNVGVNVLYSGTVAGALEACLNGLPAVALSLDIPQNGIWHFFHAAEIATKVIAEALERGLPPWTALNVNFPGCAESALKGVILAKHGVSGFKEYYIEEKSEGGRRKFRLDGSMAFRDPDDGQTYDARALRDGYITVTPLGLCMQSNSAWDGVSKWDVFKKE